MAAKKDYNFLCGLDFSEHSSGQDASSSTGGTEVNENSNPPIFGSSVGVMNLMVGLMYFCNQRPGIFVAPYLLLDGISESKIGFVLFVSGMVALTMQTPAGQLVDEMQSKTRLVIIGNIVTIVGCVLLSNFTDIWVVTLAVICTVSSDVFVYPALYATTLGIFGSNGIEQQVPFNETCTHFGNATFAVVAGMIVIFAASDAGSIFYICVAMRIAGVILVLRYINSYHIDLKKSRGLVDVMSSCSTAGDMESTHSKDDLASITLIAPEEPMNYEALLTDKHVLVFLASVLLFHFSNAAMLPLLSQQLFINNSDKGFVFAAAAVITAQISMVASASMAGRFVPQVGTKPLFLLALLAIPMRGALIVLLLQARGVGGGAINVLLLATQVLDGLAGGIIGVLLVLVTENLARGSGRFALLLGLAKTAEGVGAAFSNLVGEVLAEYWGYAGSFLFLSAASLLPVALYSLGMPGAVSVSLTDEGEGGKRVQDNLSVASHHGGRLADSSSTHSSASSVELRMTRSFGQRPGADVPGDE